MATEFDGSGGRCNAEYTFRTMSLRVLVDSRAEWKVEDVARDYGDMLIWWLVVVSQGVEEYNNERNSLCPPQGICVSAGGRRRRQLTDYPLVIAKTGKINND